MPAPFALKFLPIPTASTPARARLAPHVRAWAALVLAVLLMPFGTSPAQAAGPRTFPGDSVQVRIADAGNGYVVTNDGLQLKLAAGVLIRNEENRTIVRNRLPVNVTVRMVLNRADQVQNIWVLTNDEIESSPANDRLTRLRMRPAPGGSNIPEGQVAP